MKKSPFFGVYIHSTNRQVEKEIAGTARVMIHAGSLKVPSE
jgi:hypothetical protein